MSVDDIDYFSQLNIDDYIRRVNGGQAKSISGQLNALCYDFPDEGLVLLKYINPYGDARKDEEEIANFTLEARKKGVQTPAHFAVKREDYEDNGHYYVCWVLQEKAKGILKRDDNYKSMVANVTDEQYEKVIHDLCHLIGTGIELKSKNIFYDPIEGFTFIDLLHPGRPFEDKFYDVRWVFTHARMTIEIGNLEPSQIVEKEQNMEIRRRCFLAMEKVIPEFGKYKRRLLRCLDEETLSYFGISKDELTLNDEEIAEFERNEEEMLKSCLDDISSGEFEYWQVNVNEIRNRSDREGLVSDWKYHPCNPLRSDDFGRFGYDWETRYMLEVYQKYLFDKKLSETVDDNNPHLTKAKKESEDNSKKRNDKENLYIFFMLCAKHSPDAVKFLKGKPDLIDKSLEETGMSPIFMAMRTDNKKVIEHLLRYLSNLDLKDARDRSFRDYFMALSDETKRSLRDYFMAPSDETKKSVLDLKDGCGRSLRDYFGDTSAGQTINKISSYSPHNGLQDKIK